ncbi:hypothetical protein C8R45DRAFT_1079327 [Mycena sanguinolenta]|nr:hypothetical protein C8R45DRAFT_1079327 [Mycena sanguinolenta]
MDTPSSRSCTAHTSASGIFTVRIAESDGGRCGWSQHGSWGAHHREKVVMSFVIRAGAKRRHRGRAGAGAADERKGAGREDQEGCSGEIFARKKGDGRKSRKGMREWHGPLSGRTRESGLDGDGDNAVAWKRAWERRSGQQEVQGTEMNVADSSYVTATFDCCQLWRDVGSHVAHARCGTSRATPPFQALNDHVLARIITRALQLATYQLQTKLGKKAVVQWNPRRQSRHPSHYWLARDDFQRPDLAGAMAGARRGGLACADSSFLMALDVGGMKSFVKGWSLTAPDGITNSDAIINLN